MPVKCFCVSSHKNKNTENTYKADAAIIPILQIRKLRKKKIQQHVQCHIGWSMV